MGYMAACHLYRQYVDYMGWTLDFTGPQMVLTVKLTSFGFNYADGARKEEQLTKEQRQRSLKTLPSLLEFYGFVYFFCTFLAGPAVEFVDYIEFVNGRLFNDSYCNGQLPSTGKPTILTIGKTLPIILFVLAQTHFPPAFLITMQFAEYPFWKKLIVMYLTAALSRFKYYFGWGLADAACTACGIGYNGLENGKPTWNRCTPAYPLKVEFATNIRDCTTYWNVSTANWLKNYVYFRFGLDKSGKPTFTSTIATYIVSAFWHGYYPGYYHFFLFFGFMTETARDVRRYIRPYFMQADGVTGKPILKPLYDVLTGSVTQIIGCYAGVSFFLLSLERDLQFYVIMNFSLHFVLGFAFIYFRFLHPILFARGRPRSEAGKPATNRTGEAKKSE